MKAIKTLGSTPSISVWGCALWATAGAERAGSHVKELSEAVPLKCVQFLEICKLIEKDAVGQLTSKAQKLQIAIGALTLDAPIKEVTTVNDVATDLAKVLDAAKKVQFFKIKQ